MMRSRKKLYFLLVVLAVGGLVACKFQEGVSRVIHLTLPFFSKTPYVTIVGPVEMADGIARQTAELAEVLVKDFDVNIYARHVVRKDLSRTVRKLVDKRDRRLGKVVIFEESLWDRGLDIGRILETVSHDGQLRIAYSMLESTRIPTEWVMQLNLYYDAVAVPDAFLIEAYQKSGVKIPVFELPLGLDLSSFLQAPLKKEKNPVMVFANFSTALDRKNQITLIRAFAKVLGNVEDASLHINCRDGDIEVKEAIYAELVKQGCSNIYFSECKLRKDAYLKLFQSIDCYVSLSKGEGFSIQPRESMALGIPTIVSNNTGQATICKSQLVKSVESAILEPARYFKRNIISGHRFNCEVDDAAAAIYDVYQNYESYLQKGQAARAWVASYDYSNEHLQKLYKTLVAPKKVLLGNENRIEEDCLITSSQALYEKYQKLSVHE